jgi:hypothetical protein
MAATRKERSHEDRCRGHYQLPGLEVQVGETQSIIPLQDTHCACTYLYKLVDGELVLAAFPREASEGGGFTSRRSTDGGRTWREAPDWHTWSAYQFPDGELIQVAAKWLVKVEEGVHETVLYRSLDNGYTYERETVRLLGIPEIWRDTRRAGQPLFCYVDHAIVALSDGSLLAGVLGKFAADRNPKERSFVIRSTDRGRTWHYVSTVAFDLHEGDARRLDGFGEPYLQKVPNGEILCFMRTGGSAGGRHWPLYMSRSSDEGKTWSHADPIADRGVMPRSCLMSNGVLAVICGRPGDWLAFSTDLGHTWIGHFCLRQGPMHYDCSYYDAVEEVGPDTLLAVYGRTDPNNCRMAEVLGTFITVTRT